MSYGLKLRARDVAKFAWLMADDGRWNGQQVLSSAWVEESTRFHVVPMWRLPTPSQVGYGYLWFCDSMKGVPNRMALGAWRTDRDARAVPVIGDCDNDRSS